MLVHLQQSRLQLPDLTEGCLQIILNYYVKTLELSVPIAPITGSIALNEFKAHSSATPNSLSIMIEAAERTDR